jgi:hypothetical protein
MLLEDVPDTYNEGGTNVTISFNGITIPGGINEILLIGDGTGKIISGTSGKKGMSINNPGKTISLKNLIITGAAGNEGAGIRVGGGNLIIEDGVSIMANAASDEGGGVYVIGPGTVTMKGGLIAGNTVISTSNGKGGGVRVAAGGTFTMTGGEISGNISGNDGGGIYVSGTDSKVSIQGGSIGRSGYVNRAKYGADIYVGKPSPGTEAGELEIGSPGGTDNASPLIQYNIADASGAGTGGGIVINGTNAAKAVFYHGTVSNNNGESKGGGILVVRGTLDMQGGEVKSNTATKGKGILIEGNSNDGYISMSKNARILNGDNNVYLEGANRVIKIEPAGFAGNYAAGIANVQTEGHSAGSQILAGTFAAYVDYFNVNNKGFGSSLESNGKLSP